MSITLQPRPINAVDRAGDHSPTLVVVLVTPIGGLTECRAALDSALANGAATVVREIPPCDFDDSMPGRLALGAALEAIAVTLDEAAHEYPDLPLVLVGHSTAADATRAFADIYPEDLAGLVITHAPPHAA